jgi:hypothetical protein
MNFKSACICFSIIAACFLGNSVEARNCKKGKPCGNSCISKNDVCHKDAGVTTPPAEVAETPSVNAEPAKKCKNGKPCGKGCIAKDAVCHQ